MTPRLIALALTLSSVSLFAFSPGPPIMRTGVPGEANGATCTACHRGADVNSDTRGRLTLTAATYRPGVKQTLIVKLEHPEAMRWGFQLTARLASDPTKKAGTFTATPMIRVQCSGGAPDGNCGENTEFASHVRESTFPGQMGSATWEIEWTPPATDVGDIEFFVAGNAANQSNNNQGDFIYNTRLKISAPCNLTERPRLTGIRHGSTFMEGPYAINTLISLGGSNFAPLNTMRPVAASDIVNGRFPTTLGCIAVEVGGQRAPITYMQANQINVQIPSITTIGSVPVRVIANPGAANELVSETVNITMSAHAPGLFRLLPTPCIAALNQDGSISGDPRLIPGTVPSKRGEVIAMYATGLGITEPFFQSGEIVTELARVRDQATIEWNGAALPASEVLYVGLAPNLISGLYQINVRVPANSRDGDNQVRVRIGNFLSGGDNTVIYVQ